MATENYAGMNPIGFVASGAITAKRAVKAHTTAGQVIVAAAIADPTIGVAQNTVADGEQVKVQIGGKAIMTASAAIAVGDEVMVTAAGAGKVMTAAGATARSIGIALSAATADGDDVEVLLNTPAVKGPANS